MVDTNQNKHNSDYWGELSLRFQREHIEYAAPEDNDRGRQWRRTTFTYMHEEPYVFGFN